MTKQKLTLLNTSTMANDTFEYMSTVIRAKNDPVFFIENILNIKMYPMQKKIVQDFYVHKYIGEPIPRYKRLVLAAGQRGGKTALASMMGVYEFFDIWTLEKPSEYYGLLKNQPIFIPVLAPSQDQVIDGVFGNMLNMVENSEWVNSWTDWVIKTEEISSPDKNIIIKPFSSWSSTGRGRTSKAVIYDELSMFEDTTSKRGATEVYSAMNKSTDTLGMDGHSIAISSLKSATCIMSNLYNMSQYEKHTLSFKLPTWEMNPNLTKDQLMEEFKFDMPTFWRDYGCEPSMWSGVAFPDGVQLKTMRNVLLDPIVVPEARHPRIMAIDPAVRNDSFGVAVGYKHNDRFVVDGAIKFTRKDGDVIIKPSMIKSFIIRAISPLQVYMLVTDTWMFPDIVEEVMNMGLIVKQHIVKKNEYDLVRSLMNTDKLDIVYDQDLKLQMEQLIVKGGAKPNVDHPLNGCFTGDTRVVLLDGTTPQISELENKEVVVLSCDKDGNPKAGKARGRKTKVITELYEIILDSGASIKCTPEHLFMLRDGTYKQANELRCYVDRLMPCNLTTDSDGYNIYKITLDEPIPVYDLEVDEWNNFALLAGVFVHNSKDTADCVANVVWHLNEMNGNPNECNFIMAKTF